MKKEHHYEVHTNRPYNTWHIQEKWGDNIIRSPFASALEAIKRERVIAEDRGFLNTLYLDNAETGT